MYGVRCLMANFMLLIMMLAINTEAVEISTSNGSCNHGGICSLTWTKPTFDEKTSTIICECKHVQGGYSYHPLTCEHSDFSNGPTVTIDVGFCMTFDEETNLTYLGRCPYDHLSGAHLPRNVYGLNHIMCNHSRSTSAWNPVCNGHQRREGLLCSKCQSGLGPAVASYTHQCVECNWYGLLQYLVYVFVPATVFCFIIIILRINLLSPPMNALVLLCHVMVFFVNVTPCRLFYYANPRGNYLTSSILFLITIYGFLNMDFFSYIFPPFCISNKMSNLQVVALDYIVAVYPLVFTAMIYLLIEVHDRGFRPLVVIWSPFHRCLVRFRKSWNIKGSAINAFATFYVLTFTKILSTSVSLLLTAHMEDVCGNHNYWRPLYYDASCSFFHKCHLPYGILSITMFICFSFVPTLFILFHPCQLLCKCCHQFLNRRLPLLHEIAKIFHQSFKDGTDGSRDCRWFAGIYLLQRIIIVSSLIWRTGEYLQIISSIIVVFLVSALQPHVRRSYNCLDSFLFAGLAVIALLMPCGQSHYIIQILLYFIPLILMVLLFCWRSRTKAVYITSTLYQSIISKYRKSEIRKHLHGSFTSNEHRPLLESVQPTIVSHSVIDVYT